MASPRQGIQYDVFPAHVAVAKPGFLEDPLTLSSSPTTEGAYYVQIARVVITDSRIIIAKDMASEGAAVVFNEPIKEFYRSATREEDSYVITESGKVIAFKKDTACGCGSRLRSWNPYRMLYSTKDS